MKLLSSLGPNPRGVRMFMLEKNISLPTEEIDLLNAENRSGSYAEKNPGAQMPSLELDDGTVIAETVPIFEYLDDREDLVFEKEPLRKLVANNEMMVFNHGNFWQPMDTHREYLLLNDLYDKGNAPWLK